MIPLDITPNIENAPWTECEGVTNCLGAVAKIGLLPNGTASGQPVVMIKVIGPDGEVVVAETTWKLFRAASLALHAAIDTYSMMAGIEDA